MFVILSAWYLNIVRSIEMNIELEKGKFTTLGPDEIWKIYNNIHGIFRGSGTLKHLKLLELMVQDVKI